MMREQTTNQIIITDNFSKWLENLKNPIAKATVARRIKMRLMATLAIINL
ncbi:hypothetical protein [Mannheimia haemolytica]